MLYLVRGRCPTAFHWAISILLPIAIVANQAYFDLEKSLSVACDRHCFNGVCLNGSCVCEKGWTGAQCDHCYGRIRLNENQSQISDGPLGYSPSSKCTWIIESDRNTTGPLNIRLENFRTECGWDYVYIFDGDGVHGEQLAAFCGDQDVQEVSAPSGKALVYFFSDLAMNLDGFNITYEFDRCPYNCSGHGECLDRVCKCENGYTGDHCDVRVCTAAEEGQSGPCLNKGHCEAAKCVCPTTSHGDYCEELSSVSVWDQLRVESQPSPRASHASVLVDDVMWTIGGDHFNGISMDDVIVFNTTSQAFTTIAVEGTARPDSRYDHTLVRHKNKLYMYGGVVQRKNISGELWSFDMQTRKWNIESTADSNFTTAPLETAGHSAHVIGSEMYVFFGYHPQLAFLYHVQIYDFDTGVWRFGNSKDHVYGRFRHASVHHETEAGDVVLVHGGTISSTTSNNLTDSLMQYNVKLEKWTNLPPSGVQIFLHTATMLNGMMVIVGGNGFNVSLSRPKQECFSNIVQAYDVACKQWVNITSAPTYLKRYGHTAVATKDDLFVFGGFNGRMLNDVARFTPAKCSSASRPEECRSLADGVKCVFADRSCEKLDPFVSYKPPFLSFVKNETPKGLVECRNTPLRQALQVCEEQRSCLSCVSQSGCGWCPSGDQCLPNDGDCVDGQVMFTTWEKCPTARDAPPPRPCSMAYECQSCRLLPHCHWFSLDHKPVCISLEEEAILLAEQHNRELERMAASLPSRHAILPPQQAPPNATQCPIACADMNDCADCVSHGRCMWCPSTDRCINMEAYTLSFAYGQCYSWVTSNTPGGTLKTCAQESANCTSHKTCAECQLSPQCGWLDDGSGTGLGQCVRGNARGPIDLIDVDTSRWFFINSPACQCNGHSTCEQSSLTLGGAQEVCGACADNTTGKHCEICAPGFYGDARNGGNCTQCECHGQADDCDPRTGYCHCRTKGVIGKFCDKCDAKYYGSPRNGTPCYYELAVDFIFTFKLKHEDKDKFATEIFLFSIPYKRDTDVTFQISCDFPALVALNETSSNHFGPHQRNRRLMSNTTCDSRGLRRIYSASDPDGWSFGTDANTTFFVQVYNFKTPITIQVSFAQSPPINWVLFFVIFAACFIVLLVVAGLLWMIKLRIGVYRRNQRRIDEIEHMASRPFANVKLELTSHMSPSLNGPTPLSVEPCSNYKAGVFTLAVRLPTGGRATTPNGTSGLAVASALCQLTPAQLGVLQAPESSENKNGRKTNIRRYIPFLRRRETETA